MKLDRAPWLLGLTSLVAVLFARAPQEVATPVLAEAGGVSRSTAPAAPQGGRVRASPDDGWAPYIRLYEQFFGILAESEAANQQIRGSWGAQRIQLEVLPPATSAGKRDRHLAKRRNSDLERLARLARQAEKERYELDFLVALVPNPIYTRLAANFDLVVAGIQMGLGQSRHHYLFDRQWLPPVAEVGSESSPGAASHEAAGIMLFRGEPELPLVHGVPQGDEKKHLLAVFLVGERPMIGIQKEAFRQAVEFIGNLREAPGTGKAPPPRPSRALRRRAGCAGFRGRTNPPKPTEAPPRPPIKVLGPSSSGSAESLAIATRSLPQYTFNIVSGSATAPGLEQLFPDRVFSRTILSDEVLIPNALCSLERDLGWELEYAALLIEEGTTYADYFKHSVDPPLDRVRARILLPSGIQAIRNAWEENATERRHGEYSGTSKLSMPGARRAGPEVSLADPMTPLDRPEASSLSAHIEDVALDNLLQRVTRYGYRYIGIVTTDVKDEIFLAERVHRLAPDAIVFVFQSNLLYAHAGASAPMFGAVVVSAFPLLTRGTLPPGFWHWYPPGEPPVPTRGFASEGQHGVFLATKKLLGEAVENPSVWIAVTGNYAMAPIQRIDIEAPCLSSGSHGAAQLQTALHPAKPQPRVKVAASDHSDLAVLFFFILILGLGLLIVRKPYLPPSPAQPSPLLALAAAVLCAMASGALILEHLSRAHPRAIVVRQYVGLLEWLALGSSYVVAAFLLCVLAMASGVWSRGGVTRWSVRLVGVIAILGGCAVFLYPVQRVLVEAWSLGAPDLLYLRAVNFSNGLSPFLPLAWLAATLFVWLLLELKRKLLVQRHSIPGPEDDADESVIACQQELEKIDGLLAHIIPRDIEYWTAFSFPAAAVLVTTVIAFWNTAQPVAEPAGYGRVFLALLVFVFLLCVMSFFRFMRSWQLLRHVLGRLEHCGCQRAFMRVAKIVNWNPMRMFALYISNFRGLSHPIEAMEAHLKDPDWHHQQAPVRQLVREHLDQVGVRLNNAYRHEREGNIEDEGNERRRIANSLLGLAGVLRNVHDDEGTDELRAYLMVAYLRHVFGQLRYALMGAMLPALLLLVALDSYVFAPKHYLWIFFWTAVIVASALSLVVFIQMDRDFVLSRISGTKPGRVTFDGALLSNIFVYAILPLIALIASQIPEWGQLVGRWIEPLQRILETS